MSLLLLFAIAALLSQSAPSIEAFSKADASTKTRILNEVATARNRVPVEDVIPLIKVALDDASDPVRRAALAAIAGRSIMAGLAGKPFPRIQSRAGEPESPERPPIPVEWNDDRRKLRDALYSACAAILFSPAASEVRADALRAIRNMEAPLAPETRWSDGFVGLLLEVYRTDRESHLRAMAISALAEVQPSERRALLLDALGDPDSSVRQQVLQAISPQATGGRPKLTFEESRSTIDRALKNADAGIRQTAVQALNLFGAASYPYVPVLRQMNESDPDERVRTSARLAIEAIQRELAQRRPPK